MCHNSPFPLETRENQNATSTHALRRSRPSLSLSLYRATEAKNLTYTASTNLAAMDQNPSKTLDSTVSASVEPDRVKDSTTATSDPGRDGPKKEAEDSKSGKATAAGLLAGDSATVSDTEKKIRRAERFGITVQLSEAEKRNSRAERFGTGSSSQGSDTLKKSENLKRKARAERFGLPVRPLEADEEAKKKSRLERFASTTKTDGQEEDKRKARAIRFSQPTSSSLSMNGKGNIEPKVAIAGKAGGGS